MCHRVYDSKQCIGECHTCQTLCIMHLLSCIHIAVVRCRKVIQYHLNCLQCKWICKWSVECRNICFDRMCQCIHTCVCNLFYRQSCYKIRIHDRNVRCDIKVSQRIFYTCLIVCDNRECCYFCSCS